MNGTSSPVSSKKSSFTSEEICRILESCKTNGVREFVYGDLHFEFRGDEIPRNVIVAGDPVPKNDFPSPPPVIDHERQSKESLEYDELQVKEERLAQLLIENPEEYERLLANEDLTEDGRSEDGEDEEDA